MCYCVFVELGVFYLLCLFIGRGSSGGYYRFYYFYVVSVEMEIYLSFVLGFFGCSVAVGNLVIVVCVFRVGLGLRVGRAMLERFREVRVGFVS